MCEVKVTFLVSISSLCFSMCMLVFVSVCVLCVCLHVLESAPYSIIVCVPHSTCMCVRVTVRLCAL